MVEQNKSSDTRQRIMQKAFEVIYREGYASASLSVILSAANLTKGAMYHHFLNKQDLAQAIIDEIVAAYVDEYWVTPLKGQDDPLEALAQTIQLHFSSELPKLVQLGCPLSNLSHELATVDEGFRQRLEVLYRHWRRSYSQALRHGQHRGTVSVDIDTEQTAAFLIAAVQGSITQSRNAQGTEIFQECMGGLSQYLTSLRPKP